MSDPHDSSERHLVYEQTAVDVATSAIKGVTYLNGGGLIVIPAAAALFKVEPGYALFGVFACFVLGLILATFAFAFAFFSLARRAEFYAVLAQQFESLLDAAEPDLSVDELVEALTEAHMQNEKADKKGPASNRWRLAGILCFWASLALFVAGCVFGFSAIMCGLSVSPAPSVAT